MDSLTLLAGDAQTFTQKVWASRVHLHERDPEQLVDLLSLDDVDHLLTSTAIRTPSVRVAQDGAVLPASRFTRRATMAGQEITGLIDPRRLFALFDGGATVVLQGLHRYWPPLAHLVAGLERQLGHPCQANAYLTPPSAQGFSVHSDAHDVFVFQTHGSKVWEVHEPDPDGAAERTVREVTLEPGLSMYLPTGTPHAARAQESVSLHVTVGINQETWSSLLKRVVDGVLARQEGTHGAHGAPAADGHLPAGWLDDPALLVDGLRARLDGVVAALGAADAAALVDGERERFLTTRQPRLRGTLRDRVELLDLADHTPLRRRTRVPLDVRTDGDRLVLLLGDRRLTMPARVAPAVEHVAEHDRLRPLDLAAHLDVEGRLVLCRRLVREGLLEVLV